MNRILILFTLVFTLAAAPVFTGCQTTLDPSGAYHGDKTLYTADSTIAGAYDTLHAFVGFEYANRAALSSKPEIKRLADEVRRNAKQWIFAAIAARDTYERDPNAANKTRLQAAIAVLHTVLQQSAAYLKTNPK